MLESIIFQLLMLARARFPEGELEPLPHRTWEECFQISTDAKLVILNFHIPGDKSSKAVHIQL